MCVRGFESRGPWWSALLGLLISGEERAGAAKSTKRKPLGRGLSSYQLFRAALDFLCEWLISAYGCSLLIHCLARHQFEKDPVFLKTKEGQHRVSVFPLDFFLFHILMRK